MTQTSSSEAETAKADNALLCNDDLSSGKIYSDAYRGIARTAAYLSLKDVADILKLMLSPAFLPAYVLYKQLLPDMKNAKNYFEQAVSVMVVQSNIDQRKAIVNDMSTVWAKRKAAKKSWPHILADALYWLVHNSGDVGNQSLEQQGQSLDVAHKALEQWYPDMETSPLPKKYVNGQSKMPQWTHAKDPVPKHEQYQRAFQLLKCCERVEYLGGKGTRPGKWVRFWQDGTRLQPKTIGDDLIPSWMRTVANEDDILALINQFHREKLPPPLSPCVITYIVNEKGSKRRANDIEYFEDALNGLKDNRPRLPSNIRAATDPRAFEEVKEWRDAVGTELGLMHKWRLPDGRGYLLKLTGLRLLTEDDEMPCYHALSDEQCCTLQDAINFVNRHLACNLEYCFDFFTQQEINKNESNDHELDTIPGGALALSRSRRVRYKSE